MKVSDLRGTNLKELVKTLDSRPTEVFTIPDMAALGWIPDAENATRLFVRRYVPSNYQVRDTAKRLRYFGSPKAIQAAIKIMYPMEGE